MSRLEDSAFVEMIRDYLSKNNHKARIPDVLDYAVRTITQEVERRSERERLRKRLYTRSVIGLMKEQGIITLRSDKVPYKRDGMTFRRKGRLLAIDSTPAAGPKSILLAEGKASQEPVVSGTEEEKLKFSDKIRKQTTDKLVLELRRRFPRKKFPYLRDITYLNISPIIEEEITQKRSRKLFLYKNQICIGNKHSPISGKGPLEEQSYALRKLREFIAEKTKDPEIVQGYFGWT